MGNFAKWLGAGLGFSVGGPIGSILGFVVGSFIDGFTKEDVENARTYRTTHSNVQSGDFEISLLLLSAVVIKADGKIDQRELAYVREHFKRMYGEQRASNAFKLFNGFIKNNNISTRQVCMQIRQHTTHASRLQLVHFLFGIAKSDGIVNEREVNSIKTIAGYLNISNYDFESIKAMFYNSSDSSYKILEIEKSASNDEVKKAYRKMVKKYHPDKLRHLGEEHLKGAEEKFREVQKAYEHIQNERGM
ncbi:TerB family tellurite resistance protein [Lutibacter sp. TH_r2]|uniref:TerB family tellurite resistance protein n=1 Tax=Lutibacter sp. TH_r2 TaxID=3082083 RepID=UPI00295330CC|nr:TerB family tellurite resistance protein [Lutibacter sp. TH_r2]MDV7186300.1 TerB family tellurite resistance protein [Lutibacter sp. TH_r2]